MHHPASTLPRSPPAPPETAAEIIARYRALRLQFYGMPPKITPMPCSELPRPDGLSRLIMIAAPTKSLVAAELPSPPRKVKQGIAVDLNIPRQRMQAALRTISNLANISFDDIMSEKRDRPINLARQDAIWILKTMTHGSLSQVARHFDRDHTTILHAIRQVDQRIAVDPDHYDTVTAIALAFALPQTTQKAPQHELTSKVA